MAQVLPRASPGANPRGQLQLFMQLSTSASASLSGVMIQRLLEGTLDLAIMYRPGQPPGMTMEHLFDEEFVLVTSSPARRRHSGDYVFVDWGPEFQAEVRGQSVGHVQPERPLATDEPG